MTTLRIGNSRRGYDSAEVSLTNDKFKLIGNVLGNIALIKKAIESYNRGWQSVIDNNGDKLPIIIKKEI